MTPTPSRNRLLATGLLALVVFGGTAAGVALRPGAGGASPGMVTRTLAPAERDAVRNATSLSAAFVAIAETVTPSVVQIEVVRLEQPVAPAPGGLSDLYPGKRGQLTEPVPQLSGGSGFIVSEDGYILTNNHVIADASRITVKLRDKRTFDATLIGTDPMTDVAVIRIDARGLPTVSLGNSDQARVGELVMAVGNPGFADAASTLDFTVTSGIISAKSRPLNILGPELMGSDPGAAQYAIEDFIQTDAVINPGNSGGPLLDLEGRVIGINTAIASTTGYSQGYGFAIPSNLATRVMQDLITHGYVRRARLGIQIADVSAEDAEVYKLPSISGVVVEDFADASPAQESGLRRHDVITHVDGIAVDRTGQLQRLVALHEPGDVVPLTIVRFGRTLQLDVRVVAAPDEAPTARAAAVARYPGGLGLETEELTPLLARQLGFAEAGGAVVAEVATGSSAEEKQVGAGHRIAEIDGSAVRSVAEARSLLRRGRSGQVLSLLMQRPDGRTYIANLRVP